VAAQRRDPDSLLNWTERIIRMRRECPEISWGSFRVLRTNGPVLGLRYDWRRTSLLTVHNFGDRSERVHLKTDVEGGHLLMNVFEDRHSRARADGTHVINLPPYAWRWYRVGGADNTLDRSALNETESTVL
jgi:maltose alpha-D-glucosyltransferase/alpha-amylase